MRREEAVVLDAEDPLAHCRERFHLPDGKIYLDGNSLGALPKTVQSSIQTLILEEWGDDLIESWNVRWIDLPEQVGEKIARLVGASEGQIICTDSTSINLYKVLNAALGITNRKVVLSEAGNFPTDLYTAQSVSDQQSVEFITQPIESVLDAIDGSVGVVMLTQVNYRNGFKHDMQLITERAHEVGALVIWDLAHSAGAFPVQLDECGVDFAVGCGYKYLNGGPGAPAFLYVNKKHQDHVRQPLAGWMGHADPFAFDHQYSPAPGMKRFLSGTPNIISLRALDAALDAFDGVRMEKVERKSAQICDYFIELMADLDADFELITPADSSRRGSQVSYTHDQGYAIIQALIEEDVIGDFREPNIMRFGFAPLYIRFQDVFDAVDRLSAILDSGAYQAERFQQKKIVT